MLPAYYRIRGWDKNGVPLKRTLNKLGLDFIQQQPLEEKTNDL